MLGLVRSLAVPVFLGALFIDRLVKSIFLSERKIVPFNSSPVRIITVHETELDKTEEQQTKKLINVMALQDLKQELMRVQHTVTLKQISETCSLVGTSVRGTVKVDTFELIEKDHSYKVAQGVRDVWQWRNFNIIVVNEPSSVIKLNKHQCVTLTSPSLCCGHFHSKRRICFIYIVERILWIRHRFKL